MPGLTPGDVGHVNQAVNTAQIDKQTIIGNIGDRTLNHDTFFKILKHFFTQRRSLNLQNSPSRQYNVSLTPFIFDNLEIMLNTHQRIQVLHRPQIGLGTGQKGLKPYIH